MAGFGKNTMSGDEDSDDMGSTRINMNKKTTLKKRKRYSTKEEETGE